jgi:hypothetical protein
LWLLLSFSSKYNLIISGEYFFVLFFSINIVFGLSMNKFCGLMFCPETYSSDCLGVSLMPWRYLCPPLNTVALKVYSVAAEKKATLTYYISSSRCARKAPFSAFYAAGTGLFCVQILAFNYFRFFCYGSATFLRFIFSAKKFRWIALAILKQLWIEI